MPKKKHKAGRPKAGSTMQRDAIETIQLELIALSIDAQEIEDRIHQAMLRTPLVKDVLDPAIIRLGQVKDSLGIVHSEFANAWDNDQSNWRQQ